MAHRLHALGPVVIGLMGPPGAGKGTQAKFLADEFGFHHIATGDLLRRAIKQDSPLGRQAAAVINDGHFMPDALMNQIMTGELAPLIDQRAKLLLDGYPRTPGQLSFLREWLAGHQLELNAVFFLDVPLDRLSDRLEGRRVCSHCGAVYNLFYLPPERASACDVCGGELIRRPDDFRDKVRERLETYERETEPVISCLDQTGDLVRIHADQAHELVQHELTRQLLKVLID